MRGTAGIHRAGELLAVIFRPGAPMLHALILKYGLRNIRKVGVILEKHPLYIILRQEDQAFLSDVVTAMTRNKGIKGGDWIHVNATSYLGPNKWFDADPKKYAAFNPENIIVSCRQTNTSFIIDKTTGKIVWRIGPLYYPEIVWEFAEEQFPRAYRKLGQIIGQHHTHMRHPS